MIDVTDVFLWVLTLFIAGFFAYALYDLQSEHMRVNNIDKDEFCKNLNMSVVTKVVCSYHCVDYKQIEVCSDGVSERLIG